MKSIANKSLIGIVGAGNIGIEIAYYAISAGYKVLIYDVNEEAIAICSETLLKVFENKNDIEEITQDEMNDFGNKLSSAVNIEQLKNCSIIFEAIIENERIKKEIYTQLEAVVSSEMIIASTTSSISINSLASVLNISDRFIGTHFLNPQLESKVVEIILGLRTSKDTMAAVEKIIKDFGFKTIKTFDSPGFISNRILSLLFLEALNIVEEGIADVPTVDWALKSIGNFDLGPFEIIDMIGCDNIQQTILNIYNSSFQNPKFRPSLKLTKMVESRYLGRKSGEGFYDYQTGFVISEPTENKILGEKIYHRIMDTLCNETFNLVGFKHVTQSELELTVKEGLNFPMGLFEYAKIKQPTEIRKRLHSLYSMHLKETYKPSLFLP